MFYLLMIYIQHSHKTMLEPPQVSIPWLRHELEMISYLFCFPIWSLFVERRVIRHQQGLREYIIESPWVQKVRNPNRVSQYHLPNLDREWGRGRHLWLELWESLGEQVAVPPCSCLGRWNCLSSGTWTNRRNQQTNFKTFRDTRSLPHLSTAKVTRITVPICAKRWRSGSLH